MAQVDSAKNTDALRDEWESLAALEDYGICFPRRSDRSVLIQDEWCANANSVAVKWQFLTQADSIVTSRNEARLEQNKESLTLRVLAPTDVKIAVEDLSAPRTDYDAPNPGLKRLTLTTHTGAFARGSFRVLAVPGSVSSVASEAERPLAEWGDPLPEF